MWQEPHCLNLIAAEGSPGRAAKTPLNVLSSTPTLSLRFTAGLIPSKADGLYRPCGNSSPRRDFYYWNAKNKALTDFPKPLP